MRWNYLSLLKLQWHSCWSLGMDKWFHPILYCAFYYLSMLGLKLIHVTNGGPGINLSLYKCTKILRNTFLVYIYIYIYIYIWWWTQLWSMCRVKAHKWAFVQMFSCLGKLVVMVTYTICTEQCISLEWLWKSQLHAKLRETIDIWSLFH